MAKLFPPTDDFAVNPGKIHRVEKEGADVRVWLNLDNGNVTAVTLDGVTPKMVRDLLGSDQEGTRVEVLSRSGSSVGISKEGAGTWLMRFGY